jgi:hypothetical protein
VLSSPIGRTEMEKGAVGYHKSYGEGFTRTSDTQADRVPQVGWRWRKAPQVHMTRNLSGPIGRMKKGPIGTCHM